jgi:hypothetical protein
MRRRVYVYFALTFVLGVAVGGAGVFSYGWHSGHWHRGLNRRGVVRRLTGQLKLSDPQVRQINQIMDDSEKKQDQLREQFQPQIEALREETRDRIRKILSPDQVARFNDIVRQYDERMRPRKRP